jgi:peptidoglycan/LPS O-acetylase OafA/YrhL
MSLSNPLPWFAICGLCLLIGAAIVQTSHFYRAQLAADGGRFECIDGLRGFLALGVFAVHAVNMYTLHADGQWTTGSLALREGPGALARELRPWLSFGFMDTGALNGLPEARYINAVYWTLAYEWMFYLALPLLALFARGWSAVAMVAVVVLFGTQQPVVFNFLFGALSAALVHARVLEGRLRSPWLGVLPLVSLGAYFAAPGTYGLLHSAALYGFFIFVVHGYSLFGLLRTRAAKLLGLVSYSIYLTHCIALFVTVRAVDARIGIETLDPLQYWLLAALAAAGCVLLSALTYRFVEHPFLQSQPARKPARAPAEALT